MRLALRIAMAIAAAASIASCVVTPQPGVPAARTGGKVVALPNADFEKAYKITCPPDWSCVSHADPFSFRYYIDETRPGAGKRSLCIEPKGREPWGKAVQAMREGPWRGKRVRFSMLVRTENVATQEGMGGGVFAFAHIPVLAGKAATRHGGMVRDAGLVRSEKFVQGSTDWQRVSVDLDVPADTNVLEVGVTLIGTGRVCADDAVLELL